MVFSNTMIKAVTPAITKSEGAGERDNMLNFSLLASKYSFLLLAFFAIPFILETSYILHFWLKEVPDWAVIFVRLQLIRALVEQVTLMVGRAVEVQGEIRAYSPIRSFVNIMPIIIVYIFFSYGFPPYYLYIVWIVVGGGLSGCVRVCFAKIKCGLRYTDFVKKVLFPCMLVTLAMSVIGILPTCLLKDSLPRLLLVGAITCITFIVMMYLTMSKEEKIWGGNLIASVRKKYLIK